MGMTKVVLRVRNPKDEKRFIEKDFFVDSGVAFTVVPKPLLDKIGIKAVRGQRFVLADGRVVKRKLGEAIFEMEGFRAPFWELSLWKPWAWFWTHLQENFIRPG